MQKRKPDKMEPLIAIRWKRVGVLAAVLCIAMAALNIPAVNNGINIPYCQLVYKRNAHVLASELPAMKSRGHSEVYGILVMERQAHIINTAGVHAVVIPLSDYGDFYRHTYQYGLLWTEDAAALQTSNPDMTLIPQEADWYIYALVRAQ